MGGETEMTPEIKYAPDRVRTTGKGRAWYIDGYADSAMFFTTKEDAEAAVRVAPQNKGLIYFLSVLYYGTQ